MQELLIDTIFSLVARIPRGKVVSYKALADAAGTHARVIGRVLHGNEDPARFPCHRVVHADGSLAGGYAFGGPNQQKARLEAEGVLFDHKDRVLKQLFYFF